MGRAGSREGVEREKVDLLNQESKRRSRRLQSTSSQAKHLRVEPIDDAVSSLQKADVAVAKATANPQLEVARAQGSGDRLQRNQSPRNSGRKRELPQVPSKVRGRFCFFCVHPHSL